MSTSQLLDEFAAHQAVLGYSQRTIERRAWSLGLWVEHLTDRGTTLDTATLADVRMFLARWRAAQTRYSIRSDLHQLYAFAEIPDPSAALPRIKIGRRRPSPVHRDEVRRLLASLTRRDDRLVVLLASHAGLRISEIARLCGENVDVQRRTLTVIGKGDHEDEVPLSAVLCDELAQWPRRGEYFPGKSGQAIGARIRVLLRRHGIVARPHDLRHSFASEAMDCSNGNVVLVMKLMRHADVSTTMRYVRVERAGFDVVDRLYGDAA